MGSARARSSTELPFAAEVRRICAENDHVTRRVVLKTLADGDQEGVDYDMGGSRLDLATLDKERDLHLGNPRSEYFVCGPDKFMIDVQRSLVAMGAGTERVHLELCQTGNWQEG